MRSSLFCKRAPTVLRLLQKKQNKIVEGHDLGQNVCFNNINKSLHLRCMKEKQAAFSTTLKDIVAGTPKVIKTKSWSIDAKANIFKGTHIMQQRRSSFYVQNLYEHYGTISRQDTARPPQGRKLGTL